MRKGILLLLLALVLAGCARAEVPETTAPSTLLPTAQGATTSPSAAPTRPEPTTQPTTAPTLPPQTQPPTQDPLARSAAKLEYLKGRFDDLDKSAWRDYWEEECQYSPDSGDDLNAAMLELTQEDYQSLKDYVFSGIAEYEAGRADESPPPSETDAPAPSSETTAPTTAPTETTAATQPTDSAPDPGDGSFLDGSGMLSSINSARQSAGLPAYAWDSSLTVLAQIRAKEIAQQFSHDRPGGGRVTDQVFECIYAGSGSLGTSEAAYDYWWVSPVHHDILLEADGDRCYIAGYQTGGTTYWVLLVRPYWN